MTIQDLLVTSLRMVRRNGHRYRAVVIAIALGTVGFILIRTLGDSVQLKISEDLELIGQATVLTAVWEDRRTPTHLGDYFPRDLDSVRSIPHVTVVAPVWSSLRTETFRCGTAERRLSQITAVDENYWLTQTASLEDGRLITASDVTLRKNVCVVGKDIRNDLLGPGACLGKQIVANGYAYEIVGTLGGLQHDDISKSIFIPLSLARDRIAHDRLLIQFYIRVDTWANVKATRNRIKEVLKELHPESAAAVKLLNSSASLERVNFIMLMIQLFCYAALVGIFMLGKIGLTNVMLSAIQDRMREIGLRKALGASHGIIKAQFMIEAVLVSSLAGIIGIVGGVLAVYYLRDYLGLHVPPYAMSVSILIDLSFTLAIGITAGAYPASKACNLDIVTALKFE